MDHAGWRARAAAWVADTPAALDDCAMVTKTSDVQRGERVGTAASNNAAATRCDPITITNGAQIEALTMDDVREKTFQGLDENSRPLLWRILLGVVECDEPLKAPAEKRAQYHTWRREFQSYRVEQPAEMEPEDGKHTDKTETTKDQAPYLQDAALMREIDKDVSRTRSDLPFFSEGSIQQQWMLRILFVYAKLNPELGYMQGMNEILAPLLFVFGSDCDDAWASEAEPDAFYAFSEIMRSVKLLYNKSPSDPTKTGVDMQMARLAVLLRQHDAILWQHLNSVGLSPDFYSFRWYMTLLAREFSMATTLRIWDALLADAKRFSFLHYVSLALVRSQRAKILTDGFSGALKTLQALVVADIEPVLEQAQLMREQDRQKDRRRSSLLQFGPLNLSALSGDRVIT